MQTIRNTFSTLFFSFFLMALATNATADDHADSKAKREAAMKAESRPEADVARDKNRKPIETLEFFGLRDDMKVIELIPGGGWYTRLLAPTLADKGQLYVAYGAGRVAKALKDLEGFDKVKVLAEGAKMGRPEGARLYFASNTGMDVSGVDMVLTFRNYHNFDAESRAAINTSVFETLKSGGVYGLVDHTRRHMQEFSSENRRRFDPVEAILEIQAAGFVFEGYSPLHYRADDELVYEVGRRSVSGNTDRWTLKFRKP